MTVLQKVKILLGIGDTSKDNILNLLIDGATDAIKNYIHSDDITGLDSVLVDIVIYRYNRLGSEGITSESYSGVSFSYNDLPDFIVLPLKSRRMLKVL